MAFCSRLLILLAAYYAGPALAQQEPPTEAPTQQVEEINPFLIPNFVQLGVRCLAKRERAYTVECNHAIDELEKVWGIVATKERLAAAAEERGSDDATEYRQQAVSYLLSALRATRRFKEEYPETFAATR